MVQFLRRGILRHNIGNTATGSHNKNTVRDIKYLVEAPWFPKVLKGIDVEDYEALQYMQRVLEKSGVFEALRQRGIQEGDIVSLYDIEFEYIP